MKYESSTPAQRHAAALEMVTAFYTEGMVIAVGYFLQGGEIPGFEAPSNAELRSFFEHTNPAGWAELAVLDPAKAMDALAQWSMADKENTDEGVAA